MALDLTRIARERGVDLRAWPPKYERGLPSPARRAVLASRGGARAGRRSGRELILGKLRAQVRWVWGRARSTRCKWEEAGVSPDSLRTLRDLCRFPVVQKNELRAAQAAHPPFGDYLWHRSGRGSADPRHQRHDRRPTVFGIGRDDWGRIAEAHARILWGAGIRPRDR